jgi:hypothetical protein
MRTRTAAGRGRWARRHRRRLGLRHAMGQRQVAPVHLARRDGRTRAVTAGRVRPTIITPEVSLSSRCTMPARGSVAAAGSRASRPLSSVPCQLPGAGCTTRPAGLSSTSRCSSSNSTCSAMACGWKAWLSSVGTSSSCSRWPTLTRREAQSAPPRHPATHGLPRSGAAGGCAKTPAPSSTSVLSSRCPCWAGATSDAADFGRLDPPPDPALITQGDCAPGACGVGRADAGSASL